MEKQLLQTRAFQTAFEAPMPEKPTMLDEKRAKLRQKLLQEEVTEMKKAETMEDVSDAICDILYIVLGTAHEYGIADRLPIMFDEVHKSNMAKLGEDGKPIYRKDGKVLKPEGWTPPNLRPIISRRYHLFSKDNATFSEHLKAISDAEHKRWMDRVKDEVNRKLKFHHRIMAKLSLFFENIVRKKVEVIHDRDDSYRNRVTISAYGDKTEIIDY